MSEFLRRDVPYALRLLRRSPGYAAAAGLTLALGVGATTAIFALVDGVVLDPLVERRRPEIGIRMALGARAGQIAGTVLGRSARLIGAGIAVGIAAALGTTGLLRSLLFEVAPGDPLALAAAAALLLAAALLASFLPARRAARVDPAVALRAE